MRHKTIRYFAKLIGSERVETHIENLISNPAFEVRKIARQHEMVYELYGPKRDDDYKSLEHINSDLSKRAERLGLGIPTVVQKTSRDVWNAQEGERIALSGAMRLVIPRSGKERSISVILDITVGNDPDIGECAHEYSLLRLIWLADAMGMSLEGSVEKSIVQ